MWNPFSGKKNTVIASPVSGKVIRLEDTKDEAFSNGGMGTGFAVEFDGQNVVSPVAGTVVMCFPTGHAIGIKAGDLEVVVHIGIDTVELKGDGFQVAVKEGDAVKKGDVLVKVDAGELRAKGYDPTTMVLFTQFNEVELSALGEIVEAGKDVAKCLKK